jgi:phospholipase/lecithinase/hemolysin
MGFLCNIYPNGRFSNGNIWVDDVFAALGLPAPRPSRRGGDVFAFGGAESGMGTRGTPGVLSQVDEFLSRQKGALDAGAVYVVWVGGNDVKNRLLPVHLLPNIEKAVRKLAARGAKRFVVPTLPPMQRAPLLRWCVVVPCVAS